MALPTDNNLAWPSNGLVMPGMKMDTVRVMPHTPTVTFFNSETGVSFKVFDQENMELLFKRLRIKEGMRVPLDFVSCHVTETVAYCFVVSRGEAVIIKDDPDLFPSDSLITKLRLLIG
jgi:hypothetical protein